MDLTVYNNLNAINSNIGKAFDVPLNNDLHISPDKHLIGESLPVPTIFPKAPGSPSIGESPVAAREDHSHSGLMAWSGDTRWLGMEGANGYLLLSNPGSTSRDVYLRTNNNVLGKLILGVNNSDVFVLNPTGHHTISGDLTGVTIYMSQWFRSTGTTGWYNDTYGTGLFSDGTDWVKTYGSANGVYATNVHGHNGGGSTSSMTGWLQLVRSNALGTYAVFTSSRKTKKNIVSLAPVGKTIPISGDIIDELNPVSFQERYKPEDTEDTKQWKDDDLQYGFIAEEVAEVDPFLASYDKDLLPISWDVSGMVSILVAEVKALRNRIAVLEAANG